MCFCAQQYKVVFALDFNFVYELKFTWQTLLWHLLAFISSHLPSFTLCTTPIQFPYRTLHMQPIPNTPTFVKYNVFYIALDLCEANFH